MTLGRGLDLAYTAHHYSGAVVHWGVVSHRLGMLLSPVLSLALYCDYLHLSTFLIHGAARLNRSFSYLPDPLVSMVSVLTPFAALEGIVPRG